MKFNYSTLQLLVFISICAVFVRQKTSLDSIVINQTTTNDAQTFDTPFHYPQGFSFPHTSNVM